MKITFAFALTSACIITTSVFGQKAGGSASGNSSGSTSAAIPSAPAAPGQKQLQPGSVGITGQSSADADANAQTTPQPTTSQAAATNGGANIPTPPAPPEGSFNNTNMRPLTPTTQPGATSRVYETNALAATNAAALQRDQAITAADKAMLQQMRQSVFPQGQPMTTWMQSIHFILKDGVVRIVGTVPSAAERQRIEALVSQVPGVLRVYNAVAVNASAGAEAGPANASANANGSVNPNQPLPPTGFVPTNTTPQPQPK